jgi:RNA polymerase sigma-70 factor, ECF subfamily
MGRVGRLRTASPHPLGDDEGLRATWSSHGAELYGFARRSLRDDQLAEEAVQETFVRAWRAADRYDDRLSGLRTWLFSILRNVIIDQARADAVRPLRGGGTAEDRAATPGVVEIDRLLLAWQVEEGLRRISEEHRRVLIEVHYRGRAYEDVATELGLPVGTVKSRVYYGLRALRLALEELGWFEEGDPS